MTAAVVRSNMGEQPNAKRRDHVAPTPKLRNAFRTRQKKAPSRTGGTALKKMRFESRPGSVGLFLGRLVLGRSSRFGCGSLDLGGRGLFGLRYFDRCDRFLDDRLRLG